MTKPPLPEHASVVVIGGGIMGCSTLYHLARMGVRDAILIERNQLTSGTTWHSAAQVRALRSSRNLTRMIQYSVDLYARLEQETGQSVGWIQKGSLSIATSPGRLDHIRRQEALAHAFGVRATSVSPEEAAERWPMMRADDVLGAVWSPDDGRVSPSDVCAALVKAARSEGAVIHEQTEVTGIVTEGNRIRGIETNRGQIRCDAVALCAGLWSREIGAMAGARVPCLPCEHFYLLTRPVDGIEGNLPTLSDHDSHLYIRDDSGGLLVGCFEPMGKPIPPGTLDRDFAFGLLPEDWDHFEPMMENALHRLPALETAEVKILLNGPESFTPDGMFMLGETAETRGLFLGCGMNSVGIASGGGAGRHLAHCIVHGHTADDLSEADAMRFAPVFNNLEHLMARAPEILGTHYEIAWPGRQLNTARNLRAMPLDAHHRQDNAEIGQFYGWERPLYFNKQCDPVLTFGRPDWFEQVREEVMAAHERAAIFDSSSFGKIDIIGKDAERFLMKVCANDLSRSPGSAIYTAMLNERGGYESDLTAQRISDEHYRLFVGTNAIQRDMAWLARHVEDEQVQITDCTEHYAQLALMGPQTGQIAITLGAPELNELAFFKSTDTELAGRPVRATRMSYVGEPGWELTIPREHAEAVYRTLREHGATPAGLYAQTAMRIEKGFAAMGHELDRDVTPVAAGLDRFLRKEGGYIGARAIATQKAKTRRTLASVIFEDIEATPLGHEPVYTGDHIIGHTTSAAFGYRVNRPAALAHVTAGTADGMEVEVAVTGHRYRGRIQFAAAYQGIPKRHE